MFELALLQQEADWAEDDAWADEISTWEYEPDGGGRWVSEDRVLRPSVVVCAGHDDETSSDLGDAGFTGRDGIMTTDLRGASPYEFAFEALRSAFEAGFAAERAVDAAMWSAEVGRHEERRKRHAVLSAATVAGAVASRAGLVPSQVLSVWARTGQVQQVARGQNRRERTTHNRLADNKRDNKRDNERGRARSRKTSRTDKRARGRARERAQGRANRRPRDRGGRLAGAGAARGGIWARAVVARDAIRTRPQWRPLQKEARRRRRLVIKNRPRPQTGGVLPMGRVAPLNGNGGGFRNSRQQRHKRQTAASGLAIAETRRRNWIGLAVTKLVGFAVAVFLSAGVFDEAGCSLSKFDFNSGGSASDCGELCGPTPDTGRQCSRRAWVDDWDMWIRTGAG